METLVVVLKMVMVYESADNGSGCDNYGDTDTDGDCDDNSSDDDGDSCGRIVVRCWSGCRDDTCCIFLFIYLLP